MGPSRLAIAFCGAALLAFAWHAPNPPRRVCVTIDDLPVQNAPAADARGISRRLLDALGKHRIPAIGFVTEQRGASPAVTREILNMWLDAGMELGNHTASHFDANRVPLERFAADVAAGEPITRELLGARRKSLRYFRHPFLHTGADAATKEGLAGYLSQQGYEVAPVTFDNQEWVFAGAYERAFQKADTAGMRRVAAAYVNYMEENFAFFEKRSREVLGREPAQTLLIHCNRLNADHFDAVARRLERRGYSFVSLAAALSDEAYRLPDPYIGPKGLSWLHRWGLAKGLPIAMEPAEPEWVARLLAAD